MDKSATTKRSILSRTLVVDILAIVYDSERTNMNDLKVLTQDYSTIKKRVDELVDEGLLTKEMTADPTLQYVLHLTEKGKEIGQRMSESLKILER
ncbi:MarR family winged helix-turn-helix transcriptional regulator [Methanomassiliicoccales archaeon LGM-RCC1]|nr:MarR family winged helix-turn-helix transcriptional regulator [Methanomassiliicoccales archaeon LGM-RCC1]